MISRTESVEKTHRSGYVVKFVKMEDDNRGMDIGCNCGASNCATDHSLYLKTGEKIKISSKNGEVCIYGVLERLADDFFLANENGEKINLSSFESELKKNGAPEEDQLLRNSAFRVVNVTILDNNFELFQDQWQH